ncbi:1,4-alpha-glucan branching protein [Actinomadura sp. LD22]|uniref:1,4-alpha-glucan branching protein n=1 Tax=Actinomadura physcomitrii TaxID=2650748 RepID=A0A6I4MA75_9ACTN|nr:1,4-alpha-glucan branching protein [Actinomadura physcomitrii]MVZ99015.1 1,4-alpha-glucan branching protein [Actinomadura physcomitrii]
MAVIHETTLEPSKLELLTAWLPSRPWYSGGPGGPELAKAGGFRLDDPDGEVGIEFIVVTDTSGARPATYLTPLTYRGAPLDGADHALVGTMEHGVLGHRWAYDGCHDPVLAAQLTALLEGRAQAQDQNITGALDREVTRSYRGEALTGTDFVPTATDDRDGTVLTMPHGASLRVHRALHPGPDAAPPDAVGHIAGTWTTPDGTRTRSVLAVLHAAPR